MDEANQNSNIFPIALSDKLEINIYDEGHADARYISLSYGKGTGIDSYAVIEEAELDAAIATLQQAKAYFQANPIAEEIEED